MNPHTHITIVALAILVFQGMFALWVIDKLRSISDRPTYPDVPQDLLKDMKQMQTDIINLKQDCINIDNKYRIKDEWTVSKIESLMTFHSKMLDIMQVQKTVQDNEKDWKDFIENRDLGDENDG
tara:strand:- start:47 stop:418 length:372 start_codon:yes stop_codon:yes gene_type:complete